VANFLDHLEKARKNCARTRNHRLAALHSFFRHVAVTEPALALQCQQVLAMPCKRYERRTVEFLTEEECAALLATPNLGTWVGRRDRALLLLAIETGFRNSELTALKRQDISFGTGAHVRCLGKGRKMRCTPLRSEVVTVLAEWVAQQKLRPDDPFFPSSRGGRLSPDAFQRLVIRYVSLAAQTCPTLKGKTVTPHTLRHSAAMAMLHRGVDITVIALWLGHESIETTQIYLHADMRLKERALARASSTGVVPDRYHPPDPLLAFLENL